MDWYTDYKLLEDGVGYTLVINLNPNSTEFSKDLIENVSNNILDMNDQIRALIKDNFSGVKITTVRLVLGSLAIASIPFVPHTKAHAAEVNSSTQTTSPSSVTSLNTRGIVTASRLNMRTGPATSYSVLHVLWQGNNVKVIGETNGWYRIQLSDGRVGWVIGTYLRVDTRQQKIDTVLSTARSLVGTPYVWGGESPQEGGFDCSGLTQYSFAQAGYSLNRVSREQAQQGAVVSRADIQPGDLIFYSFAGNGVIDHVGIYAGNNIMIHSPKPGDTVKITDISTSYWQSRFVTARRII
jgi:Cell wall-associated hydrolases (invasion-associated proteins)